MPPPILLVEDNPDDIELTLRALSKTTTANEVVTLRDGEQALAYLLRQDAYASRPAGNPAVVFLDVKLPKIDGLAVLDRIKGHPDLKSIPVIILTASKTPADVARAYKSKANAYVVKPTDLTKFTHAVKELGVFWSVLNEPPPGSRRSKFRPKAAAASPA